MHGLTSLLSSLYEFTKSTNRTTLYQFMLHISGVAVADLEFDHPDYVSRAEKSWKVIAGVLQRTLGYNVELRINLASNAAKLKKPSLNLFSCSRRVHFQSHFCAECGSSASEYSTHTPTVFPTKDKYVQTCSLDCESQIFNSCCHGNEVVSSIRNTDGNALSIGIRTPRKSSVDSMDRENPSGTTDSLSNEMTNGIENLVVIKPESRSRYSLLEIFCIFVASLWFLNKLLLKNIIWFN